MIKEIAWNTFKNTGSIDSYLELTKLQNIEKEMKLNGLTEEELKTEIKIKENLI